MRRSYRVVGAVVLAVAMLLPSVGPAAAGKPTPAPTTATYVTVGCFSGWTNVWYRTVGPIDFAGATITYDMFFYFKSGGWTWVGTSVQPSLDAYDNRTSHEVFTGTFKFTSSVIGNFAGSFVWNETPSGGHGWQVGRSTDGAGKLWKVNPMSVDPAPFPAPPCETENGKLDRLDIVGP